METIVTVGIPPPRRFSQFSASNRRSLKPIPVCCSRLEENNKMEMLQVSNKGLEMKRSDIWNLFTEAQRNILYLNKQRLMAIEELNKTKTEKQSLLNRIEQLEVGKQDSVGKGALAQSDQTSICWELLFRIDSMVLTGLIGNREASEFRSLIMKNNASAAYHFSDIWQKRDAELLSEFCHFSDQSKRDGFHIVHICTEMAPVASVGALASYVTGLSRALQRNGNLVEVILPKYSSLDLDEVQGLRKIESDFYSYFNGHLHGNRIWTGVVYGIGVTFIEPIYYSAFFNREKIYGYSDDFERFTYFSRASLDYIVKSGKKPDVLHIHNWETAVVGPLFWDIFVNQGLGGTRILFTCHGFNSQCLEKPEKLALCGLDPSRLHRPDRLQDNIKAHLVNIFKGGVVYSNKVVVLSSIHSKDKIVHSMSHGLESTLAIHKEKLLVAPYGFDDNIWDPSNDKFLPEKYSADDTKGKAVCKAVLRQQLGLSGLASKVVVGYIHSEISDVDLQNLKAAARLASREGAQFILMDTSKIPRLNRALEPFLRELKDDDVRFINKYDEALWHLIFAGSDIILCPSFNDPVLQLPLKAIKYGAAPVALTLHDDGFRQSVEHHFDNTKSSRYIISTFGNTSLSQALDQIKSDPSQWNWKIKNGMSKDFSWNAECCDVHLNAYTSIKKL